MYEFRYAKEHAIARTFHKAFRLVERCLLLGLMVAVSLEAQQSSPSAPAWTGVVRTAAGEPVAGAKVTVFTRGRQKNLTAVTGTDGRFAIADLRLGPHRVSVQLPGRGPTAATGSEYYRRNSCADGVPIKTCCRLQPIRKLLRESRMGTRAQLRTQPAEQAGRNSPAKR